MSSCSNSMFLGFSTWRHFFFSYFLINRVFFVIHEALFIVDITYLSPTVNVANYSFQTSGEVQMFIIIFTNRLRLQTIHLVGFQGPIRGFVHESAELQNCNSKRNLLQVQLLVAKSN